MIPFRDRLIACALGLSLLAGTAAAGEVPGDLACCRKPTTAGFRSCYDPCEPVGPVRRFFRSVFRVPCPPPRPVMVPVAVMRPGPACPPACAPGSAPAALPGMLPAAPPVDLGRPVPVNPPLNVPPPTPPAPVSGFGTRSLPAAPRTSPAPAPVPFPVPTIRPNVPLDRLASRSPAPVIRGVDPQAQPRPATLVSTTQQGVRVGARVDAEGRVLTEVPEGEWLIYTTDSGRYVYHGRLVSRQGVTVKAE